MLDAAYSLFQSRDSPLFTHREALFGTCDESRLRALQHQAAEDRAAALEAQQEVAALKSENQRLKAELAGVTAQPAHARACYCG